MEKLSSRTCSNSFPLCRWCHPTISFSVVPFSSCLQSFPASGSFPVSWLFTSGSQSIGTSASALVLPMNIQGWFPLGLTGLISLQSHPYMTTEKTVALTLWTFIGKVMSLWANLCGSTQGGREVQIRSAMWYVTTLSTLYMVHLAKGLIYSI